jgi:hypothetical protein
MWYHHINMSVLLIYIWTKWRIYIFFGKSIMELEDTSQYAFQFPANITSMMAAGISEERSKQQQLICSRVEIYICKIWSFLLVTYFFIECKTTWLPHEIQN